MGIGRGDDLPGRLKEEWLKGLPSIGGDRTPRRFPIRDLIGALAPILATSGVLLYAILSLAYELFYSPLGIDPAEVGLNYANILAHSVGFLLAIIGTVILVMAISYTVPSIVVIIGHLVKRVVKRAPNRTSLWQAVYISIRPRRAQELLMLAFFTGVFLWTFFSPGPGHYARLAQIGASVSPVRFGPVIALSIRAAPVTLRPLSSAQEPYIAALQENRNLLYMGQNDGTSIIYDATNQQVIRIPTTSVLIQVSNCEARRPEMRCRAFRAGE
jgi:hypothetical protein